MRKFLVFPDLRCVLIVHANLILCSSVKIFSVLPWNLLYPALLCRWKKENQNYWQWTESCLEWSKSIKEGFFLWIYTEWNDLCCCFCFFLMFRFYFPIYAGPWIWSEGLTLGCIVIYRRGGERFRNNRQRQVRSQPESLQSVSYVLGYLITLLGRRLPGSQPSALPSSSPPLGVTFCVF